MPDEITTSEAETTSETKEVSFKLEKIDENNVRKIDTREEVSVVNIPSLQTQKATLEKTISDSQSQLDQINEVLAEYEKLPK